MANYIEAPETFNSVENECCFWKETAHKYFQSSKELQNELNEFTEESKQLEAELEATIEQREKTIRDLRQTLNSMQSENESLHKRLATIEKENGQMEKKCDDLSTDCEKLKKYTRELEQKNDDLERAQRYVNETVSNFEQLLNQAYEKNAMLESEVDEKEVLQTKIQRLVDETRDLKQELNVRNKTQPLLSGSNNSIENLNDRSLNNIEPMEKSENDTNSTPLKMSDNLLNGNDCNAMPASSRLTALNVVAELLRKINNMEAKLRTCKTASASQHRHIRDSQLFATTNGSAEPTSSIYKPS